MPSEPKTAQELLAENEHLRLRLEEAEETLRAIGSGKVDAFVVSGPAGEQVFTLKGADQPYRILVETMNEGAAILTGDGTILYCNERLAIMLQIPLEKVVGTPFTTYISLQNQQSLTHLLSNIEKNSAVEFTVHTASGNTVPVLISSSTLNLSDSEGIGVVITDLTLQKQNEEIMASERLAHSVIDQAGEAIVVCNEKGMVIRSNRLARQLCNQNPILQPFDGMFRLRKTQPDGYFSVMSTLNGTLSENVEVESWHSDDQTVYLILNATPLINIHNYIIGCVVSLTNITERKRAEEEKLELQQQFRQTQKLESLGVLAGGIAHDFNNILAIIIGYCGLTKMDYETAQKNIPEIEKAAERAAGLCRQMLAYAGKAELITTQVNMGLLVEDTIALVKPTLSCNAIITTELTATIPLVNGDPTQLKQVVMNLIINASEAIGTTQGEIRVTLSRIILNDGNSGKDYNGTLIAPGGYVCLEVSDNGCGMDNETKLRLFEPFYTTKFTGRGLGMSAVLGIIMSHGGALQLFSQQGQGTTFKVYLPGKIDEIPQNTTYLLSEHPHQWTGSGTILLVEDEDQVRNIARTLLELFGFSVLEAVHGKQALELYHKNASNISLVMTDIGMPVMDGYELFNELKQLNPELPIIVSSGYGEAEVSTRIAGDQLTAIMSKPYRADQLRDILKKIV